MFNAVCVASFMVSILAVSRCRHTHIFSLHLFKHNAPGRPIKTGSRFMFQFTKRTYASTCSLCLCITTHKNDVGSSKFQIQGQNEPSARQPNHIRTILTYTMSHLRIIWIRFIFLLFFFESQRGFNVFNFLLVWWRHFLEMISFRVQAREILWIRMAIAKW